MTDVLECVKCVKIQMDTVTCIASYVAYVLVSNSAQIYDHSMYVYMCSSMDSYS